MKVEDLLDDASTSDPASDPITEPDLSTMPGSKVFESLILSRLWKTLLEAGIPHVKQSAYRKGVSCEDAIFATQEVIARYLRGGSQVYMCLYDL